MLVCNNSAFLYPFFVCSSRETNNENISIDSPCECLWTRCESVLVTSERPSANRAQRRKKEEEKKKKKRRKKGPRLYDAMIAGRCVTGGLILHGDVELSDTALKAPKKGRSRDKMRQPRAATGPLNAFVFRSLIHGFLSPTSQRLRRTAFQGQPQILFPGSTSSGFAAPCTVWGACASPHAWLGLSVPS
jgi:hypothetical protein